MGVGIFPSYYHWLHSSSSSRVQLWKWGEAFCMKKLMRERLLYSACFPCGFLKLLAFQKFRKSWGFIWHAINWKKFSVDDILLLINISFFFSWLLREHESIRVYRNQAISSLVVHMTSSLQLTRAQTTAKRLMMRMQHQECCGWPLRALVGWVGRPRWWKRSQGWLFFPCTQSRSWHPLGDWWLWWHLWCCSSEWLLNSRRDVCLCT